MVARDCIAFVIVASLICVPGSVVAALFVRWADQLTVDGAGIREGVPLVRPVFVGWNDMEVARTRFLLVFPALRIVSRSSGKKFKLLRTMYRQGEFQECVGAIAPAACPLLKYLLD